VARSAADRLDLDLAIEGLLHSEGWLGLDRPPYEDTANLRGSAEPEPSEHVLLT
jgi:hypothetical protein